MGTTERRAREKEELRRAILDAARDLFAEQGYSAVSLRKIAERIEYSPTTIYLYFKDKEEILRHLIEEGFTMLHDRIMQLSEPNPVQRMRQGTKCYFEFAFENPHYYTLMFQMDDDGVMEIKQTLEVAQRAFGFVRTCVSDAITQGYFRDDLPEIVQSHICWAHMHGAVALHLAGRLSMLPEECVPMFWDNITEATLIGMLKQAPTPPG
ncbi:MAG: TetR/AcrR family transcriptional regulator [Armatimonadaceae bacterium]